MRMVDRKNTLIKLRRVFREVFDDSQLSISESTSRPDIEDWDSIAHIKLVLTTEEVFGIRFTTDEVASIKSVGQFIDIIERHAAGAR